MLGAIIGDIIGSVHEFNAPKHTDFPLFDELNRFTDDTVLTVAVADCLLSGESYVDKFHEYTLAYPDRCYGASFWEWVMSKNREPYNSWGNGSAMRVSPVAFAHDNLEDVLREAERSAAVTHNHPEGIRGAQATAVATFLAREGESKKSIRQIIEKRFQYDLSRSVRQIRKTYEFDVSCQGTVPEAITAFLESSDYEDAVRLAISLGGDADTLACIAGGIAEAFYNGVPDATAEEGWARLDNDLAETVRRFSSKFWPNHSNRSLLQTPPGIRAKPLSDALAEGSALPAEDVERHISKREETNKAAARGMVKAIKKLGRGHRRKRRYMR